jgi:hypothetical protein
MSHKTYYAPVSEALERLRKQGFTLDFNLEENCIVCGRERFREDEFEIAEVYRYEGNTDPADEATVYGIISKSGLKGVLVTGYGISTDRMSDAILKKLR